MILLIAVIQSEDVTKLSQALLEQVFRLTKINGTGGFLAAGSTVLLIGVEECQIPAVMAIIDATSHTRTRCVNVAPWPGAVGMLPVTGLAPMEVLVGGAVVFGLPVQRFLRLAGGAAPLAADLASDDKPISGAPVSLASTAANDVTEGMIPVISNPVSATPQESAAPAPADNSVKYLMVAIVQNEDASAVIDTLLAAGHRLTRVNTAGGFFRRGNATLLIGVEAQRVDEVLSLIQANCRPRTEPAPIQEGMPMYGATVFVLEASHFMRF